MRRRRHHTDPMVNSLLRAAHGLTSVFLFVGVILLIAGVVEVALGIVNMTSQTEEARYVGVLLGLGVFFCGAVMIYVRSFILAFAKLFGRLVLASERQAELPAPPRSNGLVY